MIGKCGGQNFQSLEIFYQDFRAGNVVEGRKSPAYVGRL
jgi:hypothetical protein